MRSALFSRADSMSNQRIRKDKNRYAKILRYAWAASYFVGIGISVAVTVLVCIWLGQKADEAFGIAPKGTIAGIFLGFPVAIYSIYYQVRIHFNEETDAGEKKDL